MVRVDATRFDEEVVNKATAGSGLHPAARSDWATPPAFVRLVHHDTLCVGIHIGICVCIYIYTYYVYVYAKTR